MYIESVYYAGGVIMRRFCLAACIAFMIGAGQAAADEFSIVNEEALFLSLVKDKKLTRFGISLNVFENGMIRGRAFGQPVKGQWRWQDGYFCRDLYYGKYGTGPNCQMVKTKGRTLRFISDQGAGAYADLRLR